MGTRSKATACLPVEPIRKTKSVCQTDFLTWNLAYFTLKNKDLSLSECMQPTFWSMEEVPRTQCICAIPKFHIDCSSRHPLSAVKPCSCTHMSSNQIPAQTRGGVRGKSTELHRSVKSTDHIDSNLSPTDGNCSRKHNKTSGIRRHITRQRKPKRAPSSQENYPMSSLHPGD